MNFVLALLALAALGYSAAAVGFQWNLFKERRRDWRPWTTVLFFAHAVHTVALGTLTYQLGHLPITRMDEAISALAWLLIGLYVGVGRRWKVEALGTIAAPAAAVMTAFSAVTLGGESAGPPRDAWVMIHVGSLVASYAAFGLAATAAALYSYEARQLKKKRLGASVRVLPSLDTLDQAAYRFILAGFPLLVLGMVSGLVISNWTWSWDLRETLVAATCAVFTAYLHLRIAGWHGRPVNRVLMVAFAGLMLSWLVRGQMHR